MLLAVKVYLFCYNCIVKRSIKMSTEKSLGIGCLPFYAHLKHPDTGEEFMKRR